MNKSEIKIKNSRRAVCVSVVCLEALKIKFINSFTHFFINLYVHSIIHSFLFIYPFIHSSIHSSIHSFIHSFIHPSIHAFIHSFIHPFIHSSIYSFIHFFTYRTAAGQTWSVVLDPMPPTNRHSYEIIATIEDKAGVPEPKNQIRIRDVLFGDVWLCAGDENLEFPAMKVGLMVFSLLRFIASTLT